MFDILKYEKRFRWTGHLLGHSYADKDQADEACEIISRGDNDYGYEVVCVSNKVSMDYRDKRIGHPEYERKTKNGGRK